MKDFDIEYSKLNTEQKSAVDTIDGPVMVVAGPGTGKTQVLALRIANILKKIGISDSGVLCLTFTRSGVTAMQNRLRDYIGQTVNDIKISTFHGFAIEVIEKHYEVLGFKTKPALIDDADSISIADDILANNDWEHINPRGRPEQYFGDLRGLISILKREGIDAFAFNKMIDAEISSIKNNPDNISSRGESKGNLRKEFLTKIESLERTREAVRFYEIYEATKKEEGLMDYDDVLKYIVEIVRASDEVASDIRENFQYVLVDEHQDSSGVQNDFLKAVWGQEERPNIFVVGDDRQLIYGFSGAKLDYFKEFSETFTGAKLITLVENYRSTEKILNLAEDLLQSTIAVGKLKSNSAHNHDINLQEYSFPRDEIIGAGMYFKSQIDQGLSPNECAILVPKNYLVKSAIETLNNLGLPVSQGKDVSLFSDKKSWSIIRILGIICNPSNETLLSESLFDQASGVSGINASIFLKNIKTANLNLNDFVNCGSTDGLFQDENQISKWGKQLFELIEKSNGASLVQIVSNVGNELFVRNSKSHEDLVRSVEVVRSFIHLATRFSERNVQSGLVEFIEYINRLNKYGNQINLDVFGSDEGIKVMTLHKSKGLEFDSVWIANMNEKTLMSERKRAFTLPESFDEIIAKKDEESAKRELYVAITRAKKFCTISYSAEDYRGASLELANIITNIPDVHFIKKDKIQTESEIIKNGYEIYTKVVDKIEGDKIQDLKSFVSGNYDKAVVSVSLLNNFYECPWMWYFRNFLKLPEIKSDNLALGTAVHGAIEFILSQEKKPKEEEISERIKYILIKDGIKEKKTIAKLGKEALEITLDWLENDYKKLEKNRQSEKSVSVTDPEFSNLKIYGKIDLTEKTENGEIIITDFKTGGTKTAGVIEKDDDESRLSKYMRQLAMYSYLVGTNDKKEVALCKLFFLEAKHNDKNKIYGTHVSEEQIERLRQDIKDYKNYLISGEWVDRKCYVKTFGTSTAECPHCKLAREVYGK